MMHRMVPQLELKKKLLLAVAGTVAIALPVVFGALHALPIAPLPVRPVQNLAQSSAGQLEFIDVRPNKDGTPGPGDFRWTDDSFLATNATLAMLISWAYGVNDSQVSGGPSWIYADRYDVKAQFTKLEDDDGLSPSQLMNHHRLQLQSTLAERLGFKLAIHRETKPAPIYELVLSASGPNFHEAPLGQGIMPVGRGKFVGQGAPMAMLANFLSMQIGRKVVDKTMLTGNYDFTLHFQAGDPWPSESKSAAILAAVPRDLGLQLNPQVGPVEVIIVDQVQQISAMQLRYRPGRLP